MSPVTIGAIAASHAIASAASPSSQAPSDAPVSDAMARCAAHRARTCAVHSSCSAELPSREHGQATLHRLTRVGSNVSRDGSERRVPLGPGPVIVVPGRGGQRIQHLAHQAIRVEVEYQTAAQ